ncbi:uncharacterized protein LOC106080688 [Stomoxys calcitrans]|uniref:uncharacterized protein LOC106080688 n=1 Tax=Stomoxys calcitrans TaxID=35570 RepID=UPI0027E23904|nr:uncharacterized protein LOC106080688 [Stomoxys calcitrans]
MVLHPLTESYYDAEQKIWRGPQRKDIYNAEVTLGEVIYEVLKKNPQKIIHIQDVTGERLTCEQLLNYAEALSRSLLKLGLKSGDVIGLYANNWTHVTTLMLASFLCGTPVNALYPGFDKESVALIYKLTRPKIIFCETDNYGIALKVNEELNLKAPLFLLNGESCEKDLGHIRDLISLETWEESIDFKYPCQDLNGDDTAMILCSSGTTGTPKGVCCSSRALLNQMVFPTLKSDSVVCSFSTLYWASGLWTLVASLTNACLRIVTSQPYSCDYFLDLVRRYKITHMIAASANMSELSLYEDVSRIQQCLESVDTLLVGGSKVQLAVQEKMNEILSSNTRTQGFTVSYGMTELAGMLTSNGGFPSKRLIGSEGKLVANKKVQIIDKQGHPLGPNEHGEICIAMPYRWAGYFNNEQATRKAVQGDWLHTGDVGFFDTEGFLHVCARDNDVFKSKNFQIYPQLIEEVICRIPGVAETCVFGIPDFVAANLIACVVVRTGNDIGLHLTVKDIEQHVKAHMGSMYHLSGGVYFVDVIPKTGSGKVQRAKVLELVQKLKDLK